MNVFHCFYMYNRFLKWVLHVLYHSVYYQHNNWTEKKLKTNYCSFAMLYVITRTKGKLVKGVLNLQSSFKLDQIEITTKYLLHSVINYQIFVNNCKSLLTCMYYSDFVALKVLYCIDDYIFAFIRTKYLQIQKVHIVEIIIIQINLNFGAE